MVVCLHITDGCVYVYSSWSLTVWPRFQAVRDTFLEEEIDIEAVQMVCASPKKIDPSSLLSICLGNAMPTHCGAARAPSSALRLAASSIRLRSMHTYVLTTHASLSLSLSLCMAVHLG